MGIGAFEEATLSWRGGTLLALGFGSSILLLEIEGGAQRVATITAEARHFLAGATSTSPTGKETVHA